MKSTIIAALSNKVVATTLITAVVAAGGVGTYVLVHDEAPQKPETPAPAVVSGPSKEQEKQEAEDHKNEVVKQQQEQQTSHNTDSATKKTVTPLIVNASSSGVSGYVQGVVEDGGSCTWTFTKGGLKFTKSSAGLANVSNSTCPYTSLSSGDFSESGTWKVTLSYSSANASGVSAEGTVTVP